MSDTDSQATTNLSHIFKGIYLYKILFQYLNCIKAPAYNNYVINI